MVEGAPLLREYTGNGIEGSNPFVSATFRFWRVTLSSFGLLKELENKRFLSFARSLEFYSVVWDCVQ